MRIVQTGAVTPERCACGATVTVTSLTRTRWRLQHGPNPEAVREFETPGWIRADDPDVAAWIAAVHERQEVEA